MKILGVDWGRARVGLAVSDELALMAHPLAQLKFESVEATAAALCRVAREQGAAEIVLGLPRNMDGSEGESARTVRNLAAAVGRLGGGPVELWDERLSTWEADRVLREGPRRSRADKKKLRDQAAACVILQGYLDARRTKPGS
jgi:putative Holliday junction resolvase